MREGWQQSSLGNLLKAGILGGIQDGNHGNDHPKSYEYTSEGIPFVMARDLTGGRINTSTCAFLPRSRADKLRIGFAKTGDILLSHKGTVGVVARVQEGFPYVMLTPQVTYYRVKDITRLAPDFLEQAFRSPEFQSRIQKISAQSTRAYVGITEQKRLEIPVPPLSEQRKIATILRTWDEALEKLNALRAAKARQLDGLAAKLIHDEQVERLHLREFLKESSTRNRDEQVQRVLSVTNSAGFVLAEEQFAHRVASASLSNYKIVRQGQYAYNPSRINVGSIARLDAWDEGALSPMYVVFQVEGGLDADFFGHWLRSAEARQRIALAAQGSVRETVSFGDLGSILAPVPTLERQRTIAQVLNAAQAEISLLDEEIKAVTRQKRGLMQKLLTGEWRVELSADEEAAA